MPTSEAQKRATKKWAAKNRELCREYNILSRQRARENPENVELDRQRCKRYYWKNREKVLEHQRMKYLERTGQLEETIQDVYHANCTPDDPITDTEDLQSTDSSIVSDVTDWSSAVESTAAAEPVAPVSAKPIHPFFR